MTPIQFTLSHLNAAKLPQLVWGLSLILCLSGCDTGAALPTITPTLPPTPIPTPTPETTEYSTIQELKADCANLIAQNRLARITGIFFSDPITGHHDLIQEVQGETQWLSITLGDSTYEDNGLISEHSEVIAVVSVHNSYSESCDYTIEQVTLLPPEVSSYEHLCTQGEKRVKILGQIHSIQDGLFIICGKSCPGQLDEIGSLGHTLVIHIEVGDGANKMDPLPENFTDKDLIIRTETNQAIGVGDKVLLTGILSRYTAQESNELNCALDVETISLP